MCSIGLYFESVMANRWSNDDDDDDPLQLQWISIYLKFMDLLEYQLFSREDGIKTQCEQWRQ